MTRPAPAASTRPPAAIAPAARHASPFRNSPLGLWVWQCLSAAFVNGKSLQLYLRCPRIVADINPRYQEVTPLRR